MIRPSHIALAMLLGAFDNDVAVRSRNRAASFEEIEAEYNLIQQKKSSLSYSKRCEVEYQYKRMLRNRDVSKNKSR